MSEKAIDNITARVFKRMTGCWHPSKEMGTIDQQRAALERWEKWYPQNGAVVAETYRAMLELLDGK